MKWPFRIPDRFLGYEIIRRPFPGLDAINRIYDMQKRQIIINTTASEAANVTIVRYMSDDKKAGRFDGI